MNTDLIPVVPMEKLQEKVNEAALKGAMATIEEFYVGYNSPYRKRIEEKLKQQGLGSNSIDLPDIIALINEKLSKEIDTIANTAISKIYTPIISKFLLREEKETLFSKVLKEAIKAYDDEELMHDECECSIEESSYGWLNIKIRIKEKGYYLTLHEDWDSKKAEVKKYKFLSIPHYELGSYKQTMKVELDGISLEMPFVRNILDDNFNSYIARLVIAGSLITMDCKDFNEDWFSQEGN